MARLAPWLIRPCSYLPHIHYSIKSSHPNSVHNPVTRWFVSLPKIYFRRQFSYICSLFSSRVRSLITFDPVLSQGLMRFPVPYAYDPDNFNDIRVILAYKRIDRRSLVTSFLIGRNHNMWAEREPPICCSVVKPIFVTPAFRFVPAPRPPASCSAPVQAFFLNVRFPLRSCLPRFLPAPLRFPLRSHAPDVI